MKQKIALFILSVIAINTTISQNLKFYDLKCDEITLDTLKTNILIFISTNSCHSCYVDINKYLDNSGLYKDNNLNISTISFLEQEELNNIDTRKIFYNASKYYFPNIKLRLFCDVKKYKFLCDKDIDEKLFPIIIIIQKDTKIIFEKYTNFFNYKLQRK